jgi:3-oxoacyl-[acyl-carrier-protein] synthase III
VSVSGTLAGRRNTVIESLGVYLPPRIVSTDEVLDGCRHPVRFPLEQFTGIRTRRMAGDGEYSIDLARKAAAACLERSSRKPADVDLLLCCSISRFDGPKMFSYEPSTSIKLKQEFGLDNAIALDLTNGCAGMFTAISVVDAFLQTGAIDCAFVVSGEYITHLTDVAQLETTGFMDPRLACLTLGDAGAALMLERGPNAEVGFHALDLYTLGHYATYCVARATQEEHGGAIMLTDSMGLHAVTIDEAIGHAVEVLTSFGRPPDAFQKLIMHQTSHKTLNDSVDAVNRLYGREVCHPGNTVYNLADRGNTATTSHFVAVNDNIPTGEIRSGDNLIFSVTGSGLTIGTALYTFDDLPDRLRGTAGAGPAASNGGALATPSAVRPARVRIECVGLMPETAEPDDTVEMVRRAAEECLARSSYGRNEIGLLLHAGVYRNDFLSDPAQAALIAGALEINHKVGAERNGRTFAFDVSNGAVGFLNACHVATTMIQAGTFETALISAAEIENNLRLPAAPLLGVRQTASAVVLERSPGGRTGFGAFAFRCVADSIDAYTSEATFDHGATYLQFRRADELEDGYLSSLEGVVEELLDREGLGRNDIGLVLPPQLSSQFVARVEESLGLPRASVVDAVGTGHDLFTSALPYALTRASELGLTGEGEIALILQVGSGLQAAGAIYYF